MKFLKDFLESLKLHFKIRIHLYRTRNITCQKLVVISGVGNQRLSKYTNINLH